MFKGFLKSWLVFIVGILVCYGLVVIPFMSYLISSCVMIVYFIVLFHNSYKSLFLIDYFKFKSKKRFRMYLYNRKYYRACSRLKEKFPQITKLEYKLKYDYTVAPRLIIHFSHKGVNDFTQHKLNDDWSNYYVVYEQLSEYFKRINYDQKDIQIANRLIKDIFGETD